MYRQKESVLSFQSFYNHRVKDSKSNLRGEFCQYNIYIKSIPI